MATGPVIEARADVVAGFLSDAAHMPGGHAPGVSFPKTVGEVSSLVAGGDRILPIGAQSSLTGGATPRGDLVLSTRALSRVLDVNPRTLRVRVQAGVPLAQLQQTLAGTGLYYPPVPTYDGAFVGGTIATNAAGAATFKYGSTRAWVDGLTVVLADGTPLSIQRGDIVAGSSGSIDIERPSRGALTIPVPTYVMPDVPKLSAGYLARPGMDLVDLFIGSEGTLGVVVEATLRVIERPSRGVALIRCESDAHACALTMRLRDEARLAWSGRGPLDVAAIEYMDHRALGVVPDEAYRRARIDRPAGGESWLLVQMEPRDTGEALARFDEVLRELGVDSDPCLASPGDERGMARLFELREAVPAAVNQRIAEAQTRVHPAIHKAAGDLIVPIELLERSIAVYRDACERRGLDYAIWGHASDGNLHPNVLPRSADEMEQAKDAVLEMARQAVAMGGAPLAEHGVGRSPMKQLLLRELYGWEGVNQMREVKRALDPTGKVARGVIFEW